MALLGAAAGSSALLAACGTESDPNEGRSDAELLGDLASAQQAVVDIYGGSGADARTAAFEKQASDYATQLDDALAQLKAPKPTQANAPSGSGKASDESAELLLIGTANAVVPDFDDDALRQLSYQVAAASAARLALLDPKTPDAFVLGEVPS